MSNVVEWNDAAQDAFAGDLVTIFAYTTPAGGAIAIPVSPTGGVHRPAGELSVTTSLAFNRKLRHLLRDPRVAMAYHTRDHGFATGDDFVLAQGLATVPLEPSPARLAAIQPDMDRFLGPAPTGPIWDWLLREYHQQRVVIDIAVRRVASWPALDGSGARQVTGEPWPAASPAAQQPPARGTAPRVDTARFHKQIHQLPHQLVAFRGADGFPVVVPVRVTARDERGLHLEAPAGLLPEGGRRAGLAAHSFGPQAIGLATRWATGWLEVTGGAAVYAPHTAAGFVAPPVKTVQTFVNGVMAKQGIRKARRDGTLTELAALKAAPVE
ncbi:hypothetical protein [Actinoplanes sp. L3-i22]|uniref:hypothetical protein n=1 Tax=Actinoplanes sp. L3-i22 TaxID=2836373 RepID=UPI001C78F921|nr:hypothetical protein [Actinoplanes sp. L3-i22]BCY08211.1 hypothetical protein L3i22_032990 [Actinoplanes sp. L3-i22]